MTEVQKQRVEELIATGIELGCKITVEHMQDGVYIEQVHTGSGEVFYAKVREDGRTLIGVRAQ